MKIPAAGIVGAVALREAATQPDLRQIMDLVRAAILARINSGKAPDAQRSWVDVEAFYVDKMVVCQDGKCWAYPYTIAGTDVAIGEAQEVIETYEAVKPEPAPLREALDGKGCIWDATLIKSGLSLNGRVYPDAVLREAAPLFEGRPVFAKGDEQHLKGEGKDVRNILGYVSNVRFVEGAVPDTGALVGTVTLLEAAGSLPAVIREAWARGKKDLVGLSIDADGRVKREKRDGKPVKVATKLTKVHSVDLIVEPGAGGGLDRLVEAADPNFTQQEDSDMSLRIRMLEAIKAKNAAKAAVIDINTISDEELEEAYREAVSGAPAATPHGEVATLEDIRMIEARANARVKIATATLPQPAKDKLLADFTARERFIEADVDAAIKGEREYLARFTESGHVRMAGLDVEIVEGRPERVAAMLDAFFDPSHKDHRSVQSFRECYREITGDTKVTGRLEDCDPVRLREAASDTVFRESLMSANLANVLGSAMNRRLLADYQDLGQYDVWRKIATVVPVSDFRSQERVRYGGYGTLPEVGEGDPYGALTSPTDEKAAYAASKRGGTEDITMEMVRNDDVGAIRRIPIKMSRAAKVTLGIFVMDFIRTNPTIYDGVALFHATHGNLGAAALDATSLAARRLAMLKQTEPGSNQRLGIGPKYLLTAVDGQEAAVNLFNRNTNLDKTFLQNTALEVLPIWYWTDTNDWALAADPNDIPTIEVGFMDGNQEPELFVQDVPNVGSMFSHDKLTYKMRHIYGGTVVEFRGMDKSVV